MTVAFPKLGFKLAMRVLQSDLYRQLDEAERDECDALVKDGQTRCYCDPGRCMAPKIMGRQTPCLDPVKAGLTFPNHAVVPRTDAKFDEPHK